MSIVCKVEEWLIYVSYESFLCTVSAHGAMIDKLIIACKQRQEQEGDRNSTRIADFMLNFAMIVLEDSR